MRRPFSAGALVVTCAVLIASVAACGGSASTPTVAEPTSEGSVEPSEGGTSPSATPDETPQASDAPAPAAGENSASYTVSGSFEADGEEPFNPTMSYFDSGFWTASFGGAANLLIVSLDPSTPSVNFTDGAHTLGGGTECTFDNVSQDASGAQGTFDCSGVPTTDATGLGTADISGSFSFTT